MTMLVSGVALMPPAASNGAASGRMKLNDRLPKRREVPQRPAAAPDGRAEAAEIKIAQTSGEFQGAFRLVYDAYLRGGLIAPNRFGMRVTPYHLLPTTEVFVAVQQKRVLCTMTLVRDGRLGLPMESIYGEEVACRRALGRRFAEVSSLADRQEGTDRSLPALLRLMAFTAQVGVRRGLDDLLITVHPHHAGFYERFLAFEVIGEEREYPMVRGNPAVAMAMDLNRLSADHPKAYRRLFSERFSEEALAHRPMPEHVLWGLHGAADASCGGVSPSRGLELVA